MVGLPSSMFRNLELSMTYLVSISYQIGISYLIGWVAGMRLLLESKLDCTQFAGGDAFST